MTGAEAMFKTTTLLELSLESNNNHQKDQIVEK
jgi:hypothetical protein